MVSGREHGRAKLRGYVGDYRKLLRAHVPQMLQILRRLVVGKLSFTPKLNGDYEFAGRGTVQPLLSGVVRELASPGRRAPFREFALSVASTSPMR